MHMLLSHIYSACTWHKQVFGYLVMAAATLRSPLLREGARPLLVAHRAGAGEAPENTLESLKYCMDLQVPLVQMDVMRTKDGQLVLFHDVPVEKNLEKLTGVAGDISNYAYDDLPDFKKEFEASAMCPPGSKPVPVQQRRMSLFKDACRALAASRTDLILEFWQESEVVVRVIGQISAVCVLTDIGMPRDPGHRYFRVEYNALRPSCWVDVTFKQSFLVWFYWNVGLLRCGYPARRLLPFFSESEPRVVFNVLHVSEALPHAIFKLAKVDPEQSPIRAGLIRLLLRLLKAFTDTPRLFGFLSERHKVPTVLFIANTARDVATCSSYPGVVAVQTDFPKQFRADLAMAK
ncbi:Gdpd3 [Symbiodinium necroappetens]|uniref:Gdpd3 protein n=1 Tax=Symbiodinium necroappetens TaxID=1628268 RepID=A0A813BLM2_9DINO|nr:Gdpd3 [Symbiodinium necroappetens]